MIFKITKICIVLFLFKTAVAQNSIEVGEWQNDVGFLNKENSVVIAKAFARTFGDGFKTNGIRIEKYGNIFYLISNSELQNKSRITAIDLKFEGNKLVVNSNSELKSCTSSACEKCGFFFENKKIIACLCLNTKTISNHCHYKHSSAYDFLNNLLRAKQMLEQKEKLD